MVAVNVACLMCSFQAEFQTQDHLHIDKNQDKARSHLIGKWLKAQAHAMAALSSLAVVGLDAKVQERMKDALVNMVTPRQVADLLDLLN